MNDIYGLNSFLFGRPVCGSIEGVSLLSPQMMLAERMACLEYNMEMNYIRPTQRHKYIGEFM